MIESNPYNGFPARAVGGKRHTPIPTHKRESRHIHSRTVESEQDIHWKRQGRSAPLSVHPIPRPTTVGRQTVKRCNTVGPHIDRVSRTNQFPAFLFLCVCMLPPAKCRTLRCVCVRVCARAQQQHHSGRVQETAPNVARPLSPPQRARIKCSPLRERRRGPHRGVRVVREAAVRHNLDSRQARSTRNPRSKASKPAGDDELGILYLAAGPDDRIPHDDDH